jgi:hypothetical protein
MDSEDDVSGKRNAKHLSISEEMARDFARSSSASLIGGGGTPIETEVGAAHPLTRIPVLTMLRNRHHRRLRVHLMQVMMGACSSSSETRLYTKRA